MSLFTVGSSHGCSDGASSLGTGRGSLWQLHGGCFAGRRKEEDESSSDTEVNSVATDVCYQAKAMYSIGSLVFFYLF